MKSICLYFQVHQPMRLRTYRFFDIGQHHDYTDEYANRYAIRQLAEKCYLPSNQIIGELIKKHGNDFRVTFSISGIALEQFEKYTPEVIESFKKLAKTGKVEFLAETYVHSLASLKSKTEFFRQVKMHEAKIKELFGVKTQAFRNTELIYNDEIAEYAFELGYNTVLTEGPKHILGWKSPNLLYCSAANPKVKLLLKNFQLSDDIAFRFSVKQWSEWPLTADKYAQWINKLDSRSEVVNLFIDYETFGQHHHKDTGIFDFLRHFPGSVIRQTPFRFQTPSEISINLQPASQLHIPYAISWADEERDITAWLGNEMQNEAFRKLYDLESLIIDCNDSAILKDWNTLQISDHFYFMSTKWFSDGVVKTRINPYNSPYDGFINYMNVLVDFEMRVKNYCKEIAEPIQPIVAKKNKTPKKISDTTLASPKAESSSKKPAGKSKKKD